MDAALRQKIITEYPAFAHLVDNEEIANLLTLASAQGWDITKLQANLYGTNWWKHNTESQRQWDTLVATDKQSAQEQRNQKWTAIKLEAGRLGVKLSEQQVIQISEGALRNGWSDDQVRGLILSKAKAGQFVAGSVRATAQEIRALGKQYALPLASSQVWNWATRIAAGSFDMDGLRSQLVTYSQNRFAKNAGILRALEKGQTVEDFMAPVIGRVAEELGMNADGFDLTTGWGKQLVNHKDSETGEFRIMNDTEAIQWARSQNRWRDTGNARTLATQLSDGITQKMGRRS